MRRVFTLVRLQGVPKPMIRATVWASVLATLVALYQGWSGWAIVAAAVLPWFPLFAVQTRWLGRHYGWFALFYVLTITQTGHYIEHVSQMVQIHGFDRAGSEAHGVVGVLDIEAVHFGWNTFVFLALVVLVTRFRRNPWLWAAAAVATWHQVEHSYTFFVYATTGTLRPGLLDMGGRIAGGLPIMGPNLHFIYNTLETMPLIAAFFFQLRRTHDAWLGRAFPMLDRDALVRATAAARPRRFEPGEVIVGEGELSDACFVVVRGELDVLRGEGVGVRPAVLGPGQYFGESVVLDAATRTATVRARSAGELVELDAATFRAIVDESPEAADDLRRIALQRTH